jgi:hypothetical protein
MAITLQDKWEQVGKTPDGSPILACWVMDGATIVGRIVDMRDCGFVAEYINTHGEFESKDLPDYGSAVQFVTSHVAARKRHLH